MKEVIEEEIKNSLDENVNYIKGLLKDNSDVIYRNFNIGKIRAALIYIDGMADKLLLDEHILKISMLIGSSIETPEEVKDNFISVTDLREAKGMADGIKSILSGDTLFFVEGIKVAYVIATRFWPARSVTEPSGETVVRGSREGFTETIRFNTALIRRRIRDTRLKVVSKTVGVRSKSDVILMYIDDIVNKDVLKEIDEKIDKINIDAVLDSGYIEQLIEGNSYSPFPQLQSTERPDVVAAALYEGRVCILVDNSPFAIIAPVTLPCLFQSPDDYYQRWLHISLIRVLRYISIFLSLILPALYVAVTSFHTSIIPTKLAYSIAASREGVPFPSFVEAIIMELSLALLMEAVVRLPKPIGATIGIVGGLIIGQAAVSAGIVSPIMIIIVSLTAITSFITPNYEVTTAFRIIRFAFIIAASIIGFYGLMLGIIVLMIHLIRLKSFGIPYLSPMVSSNKNDMKDLFIRAPFKKLKKRPVFLKSGDKIRQK